MITRGRKLPLIFGAGGRLNWARRGSDRFQARRSCPVAGGHWLRSLVCCRARSGFLRWSRGPGLWRLVPPGRSLMWRLLRIAFFAPGNHQRTARNGLSGSTRSAHRGALTRMIRAVQDQWRSRPGGRIASHSSGCSRRAAGRRRATPGLRHRVFCSRDEMLSGVRSDIACPSNVAKLRPRPPARCRLCPRGRREVWVDNRHGPAVALELFAAGTLSGRCIHFADGDLVDVRPGGGRYPPHRNPMIYDMVNVANDRV